MALISLPFFTAFTAPIARVAPAPRTNIAPMMLQLDSFLLAEASEMPMEFSSFAAPSSGLSDAFLPLIVLVVGILYFQKQQASDSMLRPGHDVSRRGADEKSSVTLENFSWLHADMRSPLPPLESLAEACHKVGDIDGCAT